MGHAPYGLVSSRTSALSRFNELMTGPPAHGTAKVRGRLRSVGFSGLTGPQKRGTGGTHFLVGIGPRDRGHPPLPKQTLPHALLTAKSPKKSLDKADTVIHGALRFWVILVTWPPAMESPFQKASDRCHPLFGLLDSSLLPEGMTTRTG
jgi:hypothetical protein